jgi:hypothetical protein
MRRLVVVALFVSVGMVAGAPVAQAGDTRCTGVFTGTADNIIVPSGEECILEGALVRGNALAEPDSGLFIETSTVRGNVEAKERALTGSFQSSIGGNYKCDDCFFEDVVETTVGGSVEIKGADDGDFVIGNIIEGNVQIEESLAGDFAFVIVQNTVRGNVKLEKNQGPVVIDDNLIYGELQIFENNVTGFCPPENCVEPAENGAFIDNQVRGNMQVFKNRGPTEISRNQIRQNLQCQENVPPPTGGGNTARKKEGQCRSL